METKIEYLSYVLEPETVAAGRFNLYKKGKGKKKDSNEITDTYTNIGYGMTLESCISKIAHLSVLKDERVIELKQFVKEYKEALKEIKDYITA